MNFFWEKFYASDRKIYLTFAIIFIFSILFFIYAYFTGLSNVITWNTDAAIESIPFDFSTFSRNLFTFRIEVENLFITHTFKASAVEINPWYTYAYLIFITISCLLALSIITALSLTWYLIGMGGFLMLLSTFNIELLGIFNQYNKTPLILLFILYGGMSYYFFSFNKNASLILRFLSFLFLTILASFIIYFKSNVDYPFVFLAHFGLWIPFLICLLFIIINSFEIINFFLLLTAGNGQRSDQKRLYNFCIISIIYLLNIVLLLSKKFLFIDWNLLYINAFALQIISSLLGIWGYRHRATLNNSIVPFVPLGALLYLSFGIIFFAVATYSFITANDPLSEAIEYAIIVFHACFGLVYFIYVIINFNMLFGRNISVFDHVYVPRRFPFYMVHAVGGLGIVGLFLKLNTYPYFLAMAGFYNGIGDVYHLEKNDALAKEYYLEGATNDRQNHRSNYSLAALWEKENKPLQAQEYYTETQLKNPSEFAYVNLARLYNDRSMLFQAMFVLNDGLKKFPQSEPIKNNLGMLYSNTRIEDSIYYYLQAANTSFKYNYAPAGNLIYQLCKNNHLQLADSIASISSSIKEESFQTNVTALRNQLTKSLQKSNFPLYQKKDSLHPFEYTLLYNQTLNLIKNNIDININFDSISHIKGNENYGAGLDFIKSLKNYYSSNKKYGFETLSNLYNNTGNIYYSKILALWHYEQQSYNLAYYYFKNNIEKGGQEAVLNCCMALCEQDKYEEAKSNLKELAKSKSYNISLIAKKLIKIFESAPLETEQFSDELKCQFIHLKRKSENPENLERLAFTIDTLFYQNLAKCEVINNWLEIENINRAESVWKTIKNIPAENTFEKGELNFTYLQLLNSKKDWKGLSTFLKNSYLNDDKKNQLPFYKANAAAGLKNKVLANKLYKQAVQSAPYSENVLIEAATFFKNNNKSNQAYELLAESIKLNPSEKLLRSYILLSTDLNLDTYAEDALQQLKNIISANEYQKFLKLYQFQKSKAANVF